MTHPWKEELNKLLLQGASYADVRYTPREDSAALVMRNGNLLAFSAGGERGFGVRVLYQGAWGFAASSDLGSITATFARALDNAKSTARRLAPHPPGRQAGAPGASPRLAW